MNWLHLCRRRAHTMLAVLSFCALIHAPKACAADVNWANVGNDKGGMRYSTLDQINRQTVGNLKIAWTYHTGDAGEGTTIECTPLVIDGVMYITTVRTKVVALDASNGSKIWEFDPYAGPSKNWIRASGGVNRGLAWWSDGKTAGQRRIIVGLSDGRLISLDAQTGVPDKNFGDGGTIDLRKGMERDLSKLPYGPTSAPAVFENLVIVGCSCGESQPASPGDPRAFDIVTGREVWRFHTVPQPGEEFNDTWPNDSWKERGAANPWGGFTIDADNGILFFGTGSCSTDFWGGDRKGNNLFANCTIALDARSGKRLWHFQSLHHDIWDHDIPCPPVVCKVKIDGQEIEAVAQCTKTAYCFLFDRKTGKPLFGIKEVPAPPSDVPGEEASLTQPAPLKPPPFSRLAFTEDEATTISPEGHQYVLKKLKEYRSGHQNDPPAVRGTVVTPGFHGGATWSGASFDPTTGYLYVNSNEAPVIAALKKTSGERYDLTGYGYFRDEQNYPAIKPPWGLLTAINLNSGDFAWQVPLGEFPELTAKGIPPTGTENFGGTIVTAGGLVFIGGSKDEKFHAFDKSDGKLLWEYKLPVGGYATPCTYSVNGKQYVCIAAGGGGKLRTKSGDSFIAFALP